MDEIKDSVDQSIKVIKEKILIAYRNGCFLKTVSETNQELKAESLLINKILISLHNEGLIDIIEQFQKLTKDYKGVNFFGMVKLFGKILPDLNIPMLTAMTCVKYLYVNAGEDLAAPFIFNDFIKFCQIDQRHPVELFQVLENSSYEGYIDFIIPGIIAGSKFHLSDYTQKAILLTNHTNIEVRRKAVISLGKIDFSSNTSLMLNVLDILESIAKDAKDDQILAGIINSSFMIHLIDNAVENKIFTIINLALKNKGDFALFSASQLLALYANSMPQSILEIILNALIEVNINHKGTLDNIDQGLELFFNEGIENIIIEFVEHLIVKNNGDFKITVFDTFTHALYNNKIKLNKIITRWLLSKKIVLNRTALDVVSLGHGIDLVLKADLSQCNNLHEEEYIFVVRKAIGWLYVQPISCISFILSLLEADNNHFENEILALLLNIVLIGYTGKVVQYLENSISNYTDKVQKVIKELLSNLEIYLKDLKAASEIPELWPSQEHREIYSRANNRYFSKIYKETPKSPLLNLFTNIVLLYGNKMINYVNNSNNETNRVESPLQTISETIEISRLENLNPQWLYRELFYFRIEGCK